MRHLNAGRKFSRHSSHRVAMFRNMANSVILDEQVVTTTPKAKEIRRIVDRLITIAKRSAPHSRRLAFDRSRRKDVVAKLFDELIKRYKNRAGGYTRILKLADRRRGDASEMAILELVDHPELDRKKKPAGEEKSGKGKSAKGKSKDAETGSAETEAAAATGTQTPETGGRFRKMFSGSKKRTRGDDGKGGAGGAEKSKAARSKKASSRGQ